MSALLVVPGSGPCVSVMASVSSFISLSVITFEATMAVAPLNSFFWSAAVLGPTFDVRRIRSLHPVNDPLVDILDGWGKPSRVIIFILIRVGARVSCRVLSATRNLG